MPAQIFAADFVTQVCDIKTHIEQGQSTVSTRVLPRTPNRKCLIVQNQSGASTVYLRFDNAHAGTEGVAISAGTKVEFMVVPINAIFLKSSAGIVTTTVIEGK